MPYGKNKMKPYPKASKSKNPASRSGAKSKLAGRATPAAKRAKVSKPSGRLMTGVNKRGKK